ncbi:hypothetical protein K2173_026867 [Erythroxylum novogranatense]|uniref:PHD-type domain-containing protein n=1 Tax=Erythroxylum novogranatense TaxID=1862640 RepID=A0AAV8U0T5_9ROSI|nr:hypothetical protein K2173_026867 [Erythroxylum novogranatense]
MGVEDGPSNGCGTDGIAPGLRGETANNLSGFGIGNDGVDGFSGTSEGFRTYKRRRQTRSCSESKGQEDERGSVESASKLKNQTPSQPYHQFPASTNGSNVVSSRQWRDVVLVHLYESLIGDEGSMNRCILDALMMGAKESDVCVEDGQKSSNQAECMPNNNHLHTKHYKAVLANGALDESCRPSVTEMCQRVFLSIILHEKFTSLCKLLCENFEGVKAGNLFNMRLINRRMKEGAYECSPSLFSADIQQVWRKLQVVGNQLISLAKGLSDVSKSCYNEEVGGSRHCTSEDGIPFVSAAQEAESHGKSEKDFVTFEGCTCRACGEKAGGREYLVCDSCEEMYHISCIKPIPSVIPPVFWCANCVSCEMGNRHMDCAVCKQLNGCGMEFKQTGDKINPTNEKLNEAETATTYGLGHERETSKKKKKLGVCGVCKNVVREGDMIKKCDHDFCFFNHYHVKCLSEKQLKSCGPDWFCPSCLCRICLRDDKEEGIVLCDSCDHAYHVGCLDPPLTAIPAETWHCKHCTLKIKEINRAKKAFKKQQRKLRQQTPKSTRKVEVDKRDGNCMDKSQATSCEKVLDKGREGMDILLNAALNYEEKLSSSQMKG